MLSIGSLFSGIGGLELGLEWAGLGPTKWQVEIDPYCRAVLAHHWPNVTRFEDVTVPRRYPKVDIICGGFPCQDVSSAGRRAGLEGARSGLWYEFARVVSEVKPRFVVVENVASGQHLWLCQVRDTLHKQGYRTTALGIAASDLGAPHRRARVFVIAHADGLSLRDAGKHEGAADSEPSDHGEAGAIPDADGGRESIGPVHDEERIKRPSSSRSWNGWPSIPSFRRVHDGIPPELDGRRLRALGNAVVPQCAEIVGRRIIKIAFGEGEAR